MLHPSRIVVHLHDTIETKNLSGEELEALPERVHRIVSKPINDALGIPAENGRAGVPN